MNKSVRSITLVSLKLLKDSVSRINLAGWLPKRKSRKGRPSYSSVSMFLAYLLKVRQFIEFDTRLAKDLHEHESYQRFCGYNVTDILSHDTFSSFFRKLTPRLLQRIFLMIDHQETSIVSSASLALIGQGSHLPRWRPSWATSILRQHRMALQCSQPPSKNPILLGLNIPVIRWRG